MAGLLAARILTDYYEHVTLIERDTFPLTAEPRKGVPEGKYPHFLLSRGREILETLFPGLTDALVALGAHEGDSDTVCIFQEAGYLCRIKMGYRNVTQSRPLLENLVRQRVWNCPFMCMRWGGQITAPLRQHEENLTKYERLKNIYEKFGEEGGMESMLPTDTSIKQ